MLYIACLQKVSLLHFSRFLNCTNGTKLRKASHMFTRMKSPNISKRTKTLEQRQNFVTMVDHAAQQLKVVG